MSQQFQKLVTLIITPIIIGAYISSLREHVKNFTGNTNKIGEGNIHFHFDTNEINKHLLLNEKLFYDYFVTSFLG